MASRIDIELTSRRDDGSWTWRAAGAKQPKGVVAADLIPSGASVGDQLRAEVEVDVDGMAVTHVLPAKSAANGTSQTVQRIEVLGSGRPTSGVSVSLAGGRRPGRGRPDGDRPRSRPDRPNRPGAAGAGGEPGGGRHGVPAGERSAARTPGPRRPAGDDERGSRPVRPTRPARENSPPEHSPRGDGPRRLPAGGDRARRRFQPSTTYRNAALAELRPEELPVAEQLLRGGIPRVRQAIEEQNARARAEGRDEVSAAPLLSMAEALLPRMNLATWKDRAASARDAGRDTPLRELRSIVTASSTVNLDDEGRELAAALRQALQDRVTALREAWLARMTKALDDDRVIDALAAASRPPEHGTRLPADLAVRLAERAGAAMTPDLPRDRWTALLQAVLDSPVRRTVHPAGLPTDADEALLAAARRAAGSVPELARLLGLPIPPPPGPRRPTSART